MELITKAIRGTQDILPKDSYKWDFIESIMRKEALVHGFKEIRTPVFEHTELFLRSVGETTDVVNKEMYTFNDKSDRSITLRPEGTAGTVRAMLEHGLYNEGTPIKLSYITSCYRYEKPQAGRLREFHQFGLEVFGSENPIADAELINTAINLFDILGLRKIKTEINSIGCPECRAKYNVALRQYFSENKDRLCSTCLERLKKNPMRIIDCKNPECKEVSKDAPKILDYICNDCMDHFSKVKMYLNALDVDYVVNPDIVRGLDYYTRTVFEFVSDDFGTQSVIGGGGRYDGLVEELSSKSMPALGLGIGIERLLMLIEKQGISIPCPYECILYVASMDEASNIKAMHIVNQVRQAGLIAEFDISGKSLKAQMKYADKIGAVYSIVIGENEIKSQAAVIKNMATGEKYNIDISDKFFDEFMAIYFEHENKDIIENLS